MDIAYPNQAIAFKTVKALRKAFAEFYDKNKTSFSDPESGIYFKNVTDFVDYLYSPAVGIPKGTSAKHIGITLESWYEKLSKNPEGSTSTMVEPPKSPVEANVPQAGLREAQQIEKERIEEQKAKIKEDVSKFTNAEIAARQKAVQDREALKKFQKAVEDKNIYAKVKEPEETKLPVNQEKVISDYKTAAVKDPEGLKVQVAEEVEARLKEIGVSGATDQEISDAADMTAENMVGVWSGSSPIVGAMVTKEAASAKVFAALTSDPLTERIVINYADKQVAGFMMSQRIAGEVFGQDFANKVFKIPESVQVSNTPIEGSTPFTVSKLLNTDASVPVTVQNINFSTPIGTVIRQPILVKHIPKPVFMTQAERFKAEFSFKSSATIFKPSVGKPATEIKNVLSRTSKISISTAPLKGFASGIGKFFADLGSNAKIFIKGLEKNQGVLILGGVLAGVAGITSGSAALTAGGFAGAGAGFAINPGNVLSGSAFTSMVAPVIGIFKGLLSGVLTAIVIPIVIATLCVPFVVAIILFIINSGAYVVPLGPFEAGQVGVTPPDCLGDPPPKPVATDVRYSSDGKYAYPVAPFPGKPYSSCYHWDGNKAADFFSPQTRPPIVASENGKIVNVTLNDSLGGKYIILQGTTSGSYYYNAHLCHVFVKQGDTVKVGDVIGTMDETGNGRVQHLHYAINRAPLSDTFVGGAGNICPYQEFESRFNFGICNFTNYCVTP